MADAPGEDRNLSAQIFSLKPKTDKPPVDMQSLDALPFLDVATAADPANNSLESARDVGDPATRAVMFGRYTNQINARIERAWIRPSTPVNDGLAATGQLTGNGIDGEDSFSCRVQIRQDIRGYVQEVLLLECNGTEAWRRSLVTAINQSSPLPAPPTPTVFVHALTMTFEAHAYRSGDPPYAYQAAAQRGGEGAE